MSLQVPEIFNRILESNPMQLSTITETSGKDVGHTYMHLPIYKIRTSWL